MDMGGDITTPTLFGMTPQQFYIRKLLHKDILSCGFNDVQKSEFSTCMPHPNFKRLVLKACDLSKSTKQMKKDGKVDKFIKLRQMGVIEKLLRLGGIV